MSLPKFTVNGYLGKAQPVLILYDNPEKGTDKVKICLEVIEPTDLDGWSAVDARWTWHIETTDGAPEETKWIGNSWQGKNKLEINHDFMPEQAWNQYHPNWEGVYIKIGGRVKEDGFIGMWAERTYTKGGEYRNIKTDEFVWMWGDFDFADDEQEDDEEEVVVEEESQMPLTIRFVWGNIFIRILQSLLFFRNFIKMPSHVQVAYDETRDISAEASGVKLVPPPTKKHETYRLDLATPISDHMAICDKYLGAKYDYYFYIRWWLNTSLAYMPLALMFLLGPLWALGWVALVVAGGLLLKIPSKKTWACAELTAQIAEDWGEPFGFEKKHIASPFYMWLMVKFARWDKE